MGMSPSGCNRERVTLMTPPNGNERLARTGDRRGLREATARLADRPVLALGSFKAVLSAGPVHFQMMNGSALVTNCHVSFIIGWTLRIVKKFWDADGGICIPPPPHSTPPSKKKPMRN